MITSKDKWKLYDHLRVLDDLLLYLANRDIHRLMTFMPPQHGKSLLISKNFPVWYLGHNPDHRVILASYEASFATSWASKAKDVFELWAKPIFGLELKQDSKAKNHWDIKGHDGGMDAAGAGGAQTGKQAHFFNIDDPHKNPQEARSPIFQERIIDWYLGAVDTRLPKDGLINLTQTRWDELDLSGRILENEDHIYADEALEILQNGGKIKRDCWVILSLAAIAGPKDILKRKPGTALCPDLFPIDVLKSKKKRMDARDPGMFEALYQQEPVPPEGVLFRDEYFETIEVLPPKEDRLNDIIWFDLADTEVDESVPIEKRGAATAGVRLILTKDYKVIVADVFEFWKGHGNVEVTIAEIAKSLGKGVKIRVPQDPGSAGKTVVRDYSHLLLGYDVDGIREDKDKESRAKPVAAWAKINKLFLLKADWNTRFKYVLKRFPRGKHKDIPDALSGSYSLLFPEEEEEAYAEWVDLL